jgi:hypothetical protein
LVTDETSRAHFNVGKAAISTDSPAASASTILVEWQVFAIFLASRVQPTNLL